MTLRCKSIMEKIIKYLLSKKEYVPKERKAVAEGVLSTGYTVDYYDGLFNAYDEVLRYITKVADVKTLAEINKELQLSPSFAAFGIRRQTSQTSQ